MQLNLRRVAIAAVAAIALFFGLGRGTSSAGEGLANVSLTTKGAGHQDIPLALPTPRGGTATDEFYATLRRDLELSGWFRIIDPAAYVEPTGTGIRLGDFDFAAKALAQGITKFGHFIRIEGGG